MSWAVIVVGFTFITMLNALALLSTARTDLVQRLVEEKSAEALTLSNNLSLVLEHAADARCTRWLAPDACDNSRNHSPNPKCLGTSRAARLSAGASAQAAPGFQIWVPPPTGHEQEGPSLFTRS